MDEEKMRELQDFFYQPMRLEQAVAAHRLHVKTVEAVVSRFRPEDAAAGEALCARAQLGVQETEKALQQSREAVMEAIALVPGIREQLLLEQRYLCGKSWIQLSAELGYDRRWVLRLHRMALTRLLEVLDGNPQPTKKGTARYKGGSRKKTGKITAQ